MALASYLETNRQTYILFVEIQMYLLTSQDDFVGVQNGLVDIQLNSGDQLN